MAMTQRERILAVYRGEMPDVVPYMLDLSHWFYHKYHMPWDLSQSFETPETELIDYHKRANVGFFIANLASFYATQYRDDVVAETVQDRGGDQTAITWRLSTPLGSIERERVWEEKTYAWAIKRWGVKSEQDLRILGYALASRTYVPLWDHYKAWADYAGDCGVIYIGFGYTAIGHLLNLWMGTAPLIYATYDWPDTMHEVVAQINDNALDLVDLLATSPAEVVIMTDNFSSDLQPPHFFAEWSRPFYVEAIRRLHAAGKYVAVHIDGKLRGSLRMIRDVGADCADAVTPVPMGDLTPEECRKEAGPDFILSGGVSPDLWLPETSTERFTQAVVDWLEMKRHGPSLIASAGDQVPPGAVEGRIELMGELVEQYGKY
jgi:hypothetical protein